MNRYTFRSKRKKSRGWKMYMGPYLKLHPFNSSGKHSMTTLVDVCLLQNILPEYSENDTS